MKKFIIILLFCASQVATAFPTITSINPTINALMKQVDIDTLEAKIRYLQNLGPRPFENFWFYEEYHPNNIAAKNWLFQQYENFGKLDVYFHHFLPESQCRDTLGWRVWQYKNSQTDSVFQYSIPLCFDQSKNVVAVQKGTVYPDEYIIVCSHFDQPDGPGANDNASGTAGVIEIARILSKHKFKRSIIYINFNGEESGNVDYSCLGSNIFTYYCRQNDINILGVFNLDMIGYNPIDKSLLIFYDDWPLINKNLGKYFGEVANLYLPDISALPPQYEKDTSRNYVGRGDDMNFIRSDYPAMYMGDVLGYGLENYGMRPCYHSPCDTIGIGKEDAGVNSMELVRAYTQATLVAIAELAELDITNILENNIYDISIVPNPTNNETTLTLDLQTAGTLTICLNDLLGNELFEIYNSYTDAGIFSKTFSIEALPIGVYYLKITHNGNVRIEKVVKN